MADVETSFQDLCYERLIREFALVSFCHIFYGIPTGTRTQTRYLQWAMNKLTLSRPKIINFLAGDNVIANEVILKARFDGERELAARPAKIPSDKYIHHFLAKYIPAVRRNLTDRQFIDHINSGREIGVSLRLDDVLRRHFKLDVWNGFFSKIFSVVSYDLVFDELGSEGFYKEEDFLPSFLDLEPTLPEVEVLTDTQNAGVDVLSSVLPEVEGPTDTQIAEEDVPSSALPKVKVPLKKRIPRKPGPGKRGKNEPPQAPIAIVPLGLFENGEVRERLQRAKKYWKSKFKDAEWGDPDTEYMFRIWYPSNTEFSTLDMVEWANNGDDPRIEKLLTDAGF